MTRNGGEVEELASDGTLLKKKMNLMNAVIDPRGEIDVRKIELSKRKDLNGLREGRILFFDNTKLSFCNYSEIFVGIKEKLQEFGLKNFSDHRQTVRGSMTDDIRGMAARLASEGYAAAVVALADMGTSPMTTVLAIELEKAGIPTLLISAPPGDELAKHVAYYRAGNLCICRLDIYQASTRAEVAEEVQKNVDYIVNSLTLSGDKLSRLAEIHPLMDDNAGLDLNTLLELPTEAQPGTYMEEIMAGCEYLSVGDGLPVIPPTQERISKMAEFCPYPLNEVLIPEAGPSGKDITVRDVVINSIMAGCEPRYLPVVVATFEAMRSEKYNFQQSVTTSYNGGNLVLVSGPLARELNIHSGQGCLGPGFRANATIGRAVNLTILNVCRAYPGKADLGCLGSPAEFTYCFAESLEDSPWPGINEERFDSETSTVYVLKGEPPTDVVDFLSETADSLLQTIIDSASHLGRMNAYIPGTILIVLTPDHSRILQKANWTKEKLREYLYSRIHNPRKSVEGRGLVPVRPDIFKNLDPVPAARSPEDIELVVAGGRGGHSAIIASWGLYSEAVVQPITLPNGKRAKTIAEFEVHHS